MRLTIIPSDNIVGVNNDFISGLDFSACGIPNNIHALQWYETEGELEFVDNPDRTKPQNEIVTTIPGWADSCVIAYNEAKAAIEKSRLAAESARLAQAEKPILTTQI